MDSLLELTISWVSVNGVPTKSTNLILDISWPVFYTCTVVTPNVHPWGAVKFSKMHFGVYFLYKIAHDLLWRIMHLYSTMLWLCRSCPWLKRQLALECMRARNSQLKEQSRKKTASCRRLRLWVATKNLLNSLKQEHPMEHVTFFSDRFFGKIS